MNYELHDDDRRHLVDDSGIGTELLDRLGVYTAEDPEQLPDSFTQHGRSNTGIVPAIVFPRRDDDGTCVPQLKLRLGEDRTGAYIDQRGREHKYLMPAGASSVLWAVRTETDAERVVLCEGTKQALAFASWAPAGVSIYSIAGCFNWRTERMPLPTLSAVAGKHVVICLDGDAETNRMVFDAGTKLAGACKNEGAESVTFVRLQTGDERGIDDVLAARAPGDRERYLSALLANTYLKPADRRPDASKSEGVALDANRAQITATDARIADEFVRRYGRRLRYCASRDGAEWYSFTDAGYWSASTGASDARSWAHELRGQVQAVREISGQNGEPILVDESEWMEQSGRIASIVTEASARRQLRVMRDELDDIDRTASLFTVANGTIDLRTGELLAHDPDHLITQHSPIDYDEQAQCPRFDEFLRYLFPSQEMRDFLARLFGMAMLGQVTEHRLPVLLGDGRNGKGTLLRLAGAVFGDYHTGISKSLLVQTKFEEHATVYAGLWRKRLVTTEEFASAAQWDVAKINELTGGDTLKGRFMRQDEFAFRPSHTLILATNHWPAVASSEEAFWKRAMRVPFTRQLEHPDYRVEDRIRRDELPGILAWMVRGCRDYLTNGLGEPPEVVVATQESRAESSITGQFVTERIDITGVADDMLTKLEVYDGYLDWHRKAHPGAVPLSMKAFVGEVRSLSLPGVDQYEHRVRRNADGSPTDRQVRCWTGVRWASADRRDDAEALFDGERDGSADRLRDELDTSSSQVGTGSDCLGLVSKENTHRKNNTNRGDGNTYRDSGAAYKCADRSPGSNPSHTPTLPTGTPITLDIETDDAAKLWSSPCGFVRLGGYTDPADPSTVTVTESGDDLVRLIESSSAPIVGHNVLGFDLLALARHHGLDLATLAESDRIADTRLLAQLHDPPWSGKLGRNRRGYYSLDAVAERHGLPGKTDDLAALARRFGGYGSIPTDNPAFRDYLTGDVHATAALAQQLPMTEYARREHRVVARLARTSVIGFRVDTDLLTRRIDEGQTRRNELLQQLHDEHDLPLVDAKGRTLRSPQATDAGKAAIEAAFASLRIRLPRTGSGKPDLSKTTLAKIGDKFADREGVAELCELVSAVNGIRTVYGTVADHLVGDRVHPTVWPGQSSGRWSVTNPGMTVFGKRQGRHVERAIFLPDEGEVLLAADLDQVDMRAVAALSGDREYQRLFEPGRDVHAEIAKRVFGDPSRREAAKAVGHGWNYGRSAQSMIDTDGIDPELAITFCREMAEQFPDVVEWQQRVRGQAREHELLDNGFGRSMRCDAREAHTEAPALCGQGAARDLLVEGILRLRPELVGMIRTIVHDELIFSVPPDAVPEVSAAIRDAFSFEWRGVPITAGVSDPGGNWAALYEK